MEAVQFVKNIWHNANTELLAIENPVGWLNNNWRKPDQVFHPYFFGDPESKRTCLWLKNLPNLVRTHYRVKPKIYGYFETGKQAGHPIYFHSALIAHPERALLRAQTFPGVAKKIAEQWGQFMDFWYGIK